MKFLVYILFFLLTGLYSFYSQSIGSPETFVVTPNKDTVKTEEILVTANRIKIPPLLAPNKIQLLTDKFISKLNSDKLSDLLSCSDAVFINDYGFNSGLKTISLNATQTEHTLILLNGVKLNSSENAQFDASLLQTDDINRVEISHGGSSSLYGSEAIGGIINIISNEKYPDKPFNVNVSNSISSFGFNKFYIGTNNYAKFSGSKTVNLNLSYSNETSKNNYQYDYFDGFSNVLKERLNNDYRTNTFIIGTNYKTDKSSSLSMFTFYNKFNRGVPGTDFAFVASRARQLDNNVISSLMYNKIINNNFDLNTNFNYKYSLMKYYDPLTYNTSYPINDFYKINTFVNSTGLDIFKNSKNEITTGYELSYDKLTSNEVEKCKEMQIGFYGAAKFELDKFLNQITFFPSARYDYFSTINKNVLTGKLGINIKPIKKSNFSLKSSFSNNFRTPTFNELFWIGLGNKNLLPEKSISYDGGVYYDFKFLTDNTIEASYFNINTIDRIVWTPDNSGIWRPINIGKVNSQGIDISLKSDVVLSKVISTEFNLNYNYAVSIKKDKDFPDDPTYNKQLIGLPQEYAKSSLFIEYKPPISFLKLIAVNIFYIFTGKRYLDLENTKFTPFYDLFNGNLSLNLSLFNTITSFKFAINNIFNKDYEVVSGYPMPLRNYSFQIGIKY